MHTTLPSKRTRPTVSGKTDDKLIIVQLCIMGDKSEPHPSVVRVPIRLIIPASECKCKRGRLVVPGKGASAVWCKSSTDAFSLQEICADLCQCGNDWSRHWFVGCIENDDGATVSLLFADIYKAIEQQCTSEFNVYMGLENDIIFIGQVRPFLKAQL